MGLNWAAFCDLFHGLFSRKMVQLQKVRSHMRTSFTLLNDDFIS